jgi:hypothetical protein
VESIEVEEAILATRKVSLQPGAVWGGRPWTRKCGNTRKVKDCGWIFPFVKPEQRFNREDEVELVRRACWRRLRDLSERVNGE